MEISTIKQVFIDSVLPPKWAIFLVLESPEKFGPLFLQIIEEMLRDPKKWLSEYRSDHVMALYILSKMRDKRLFPYLVACATLDEEVLEDLYGDIITQDFSSMLISTYNGDMASLLKLIENKEVDVFLRDAAMKCLVGLYAAHVISREQVIAYFDALLQKCLNSTDKSVEDAKEYYDDENLFNAFVVDVASTLGSQQLYALIYKLFELDIVDKNFIDEIDVHSRQIIGQEACLSKYLYGKSYHLPIENLVEAISWMYESHQDIGRNETCPCLSGKKFKKCCIDDYDKQKICSDVSQALSMSISSDDAWRAIRLFGLLDGFVYEEEIENNYQRAQARKLWQDDPGLIDKFLEHYSSKLPVEDIHSISQCKKMIRDRFAIIKYCTEYAIFYGFNSQRYYAVKSLTESFDEVFFMQRLPIIIDTALYSYNDIIIWDGLATVIEHDVDQDVMDSLLFEAGDAAMRSEIVMSL